MQVVELENDANVISAKFAQFRATAMVERHPIDHDGASVWLVECTQQVQQGGLARTRRAGERNKLAVGHRKVGAVEHDMIVERLADPGGFDGVDEGLRPVRSFVSQRRAGAFLGEGWFTFEPGLLRGHSQTAGGGVTTQEVSIAGPLDYFVPHAVAGDSWITPCHDRSSTDWLEVRNGFTTSLLPDGATGPVIERHRGLRQRWSGREVVTVPAGEFLVDHFVVSARPGIEEHLWVTADEWATLVKLRSDRLRTTYLLCEYEEAVLWPPLG